MLLSRQHFFLPPRLLDYVPLHMREHDRSGALRRRDQGDVRFDAEAAPPARVRPPARATTP
jgi:hypothetical protein